MLSCDDVLNMLHSLEAILEGHFVYVSKDHGPRYLAKKKILEDPAKTRLLAETIAARLMPFSIDAIVGPQTGGAILAKAVAIEASCRAGQPILAVSAAKLLDDFTFDRDDLPKIQGKRIGITEDILTTGQTARKVARLVRASGGTVVWISAICNRGGVKAESFLGNGHVPHLLSLLDLKMDQFDEADCPLCKAGVPVNINVGHGAGFLANRRP